MYDSSEMAYVKVSTFKEKVFCKSLSIFAWIMETLYQEEQKTFLTLQTASEWRKEWRKELIAEWIYFQVGKVINEFNAIKIPRLTWDKKGKKEENQNTLNSLLKPCLPLMWNYIDIFRSLNINDSSFTVVNPVSEGLLKFIPNGGQEQAAKIVLKNGKSINVWRSDEQIFCLAVPTTLPFCPGAQDVDK